MGRLSLALFLSILLFGGKGFAQDSIKEWIIQDGLSTDCPSLYKVGLASKVSYDLTNGFYFYSYTLTNNRGNSGDIWMFEIDIRRHPGSVVYDTVGLKFANKFERGDFQRYYRAAANAVEAIGFPALPNLDWVGVIAHNSVANFGTGSQLLKPDSSVGLFTMMSKAPPGIRAFTAYSYFDVGEYTPDIHGDTTAALDSIYNAVNKYIDSMTANMNYHGWTIGPTAPPTDFSPSAWIDTLASYKHQAVSLGWIDNQGIANSLDSKLDNAKSRFAAGDTTAAKNVLNAFVSEVEAQNGKHLTSEAYALLKYNAEYLIRRLP